MSEKTEFRANFFRLFSMESKPEFKEEIFAYTGPGDAPAWLDEMGIQGKFYMQN